MCVLRTSILLTIIQKNLRWQVEKKIVMLIFLIRARTKWEYVNEGHSTPATPGTGAGKKTTSRTPSGTPISTPVSDIRKFYSPVKIIENTNEHQHDQLSNHVAQGIHAPVTPLSATNVTPQRSLQLKTRCRYTC